MQRSFSKTSDKSSRKPKIITFEYGMEWYSSMNIKRGWYCGDLQTKQYVLPLTIQTVKKLVDTLKMSYLSLMRSGLQIQSIKQVMYLQWSCWKISLKTTLANWIRKYERDEIVEELVRAFGKGLIFNENYGTRRWLEDSRSSHSTH